MTRRWIAGMLSVTFLGVVLLPGCDAGPSTGPAPEGHDGKSATGHSGASPAAGADSPEAKAATRKAAAPK